MSHHFGNVFFPLLLNLDVILHCGNEGGEGFVAAISRALEGKLLQNGKSVGVGVGGLSHFTFMLAS